MLLLNTQGRIFADKVKKRAGEKRDEKILPYGVYRARPRYRTGELDPSDFFHTWTYAEKETKPAEVDEFAAALTNGDPAALMRLLNQNAEKVANAVLRLKEGGQDIAVDVNEAIRQILMQSANLDPANITALQNTAQYEGMIKNIFQNIFKEELGGLDLADVAVSDAVMRLLQQAGGDSGLSLDQLIVEKDPVTGKKTVRLRNPDAAFKNIFKAVFSEELAGVDPADIEMSDEVRLLIQSGAALDPSMVIVETDPLTGKKVVKLKDPNQAMQGLVKSLLKSQLPGVDLAEVAMSEEVKQLLLLLPAGGGGALDPDLLVIYEDPVTGKKTLRLRDPDVLAKAALQAMFEEQLGGLTVGDVEMSDEVKFLMRTGGNLDPDQLIVEEDPLTGKKTVRLKDPEAGVKNIFRSLLAAELGDTDSSEIRVSEEVLRLLQQSGGTLDPNLVTMEIDPVTGEKVVKLKDPGAAALATVRSMVKDKLGDLVANDEDVQLSEELKMLLQGGGKVNPDDIVVHVNPITGEKTFKLKNPENSIKTMFKNILGDQLGEEDGDFSVSEEVRLLLQSGGTVDPDLLEVYVDESTGQKFVRLKDPENAVKNVFKNLFKNELAGIDAGDVEMSDEIKFLLQTGSKLDPDQFEVYEDPDTGQKIVRLKDPETYFSNLNIKLEDVAHPEKFKFGAKSKAPRGQLKPISNEDIQEGEPMIFMDEEGKKWTVNENGDYEEVLDKDVSESQNSDDQSAGKRDPRRPSMQNKNKTKTSKISDRREFKYGQINDSKELMRLYSNLDLNDGSESKNGISKSRMPPKKQRKNAEKNMDAPKTKEYESSLGDSDFSDLPDEDDEELMGLSPEERRECLILRRKAEEARMREEMGEEAYAAYEIEKREQRHRRKREKEEARVASMSPNTRRQYWQQKQLERIHKEKKAYSIKMEALRQRRAEEEAERQRIEDELLATMTEEEKVEYFRLKTEALEEKKRLEVEEARLALEEARKIAQQQAREQALLEARLQFVRGMQVESEGLKRDLNVTPGFAWSYFEFLAMLQAQSDPSTVAMDTLAATDIRPIEHPLPRPPSS